MKTLSLICLFLLMFCFCTTEVQARLAVVLQQQDAVILSVDSEGRMMTNDYLTCILVNDEVSAKAAELNGQKTHILFYAAGEKKYCVDLRPFAEPDFEIPAIPNRGSRSKEKALH